MKQTSFIASEKIAGSAIITALMIVAFIVMVVAIMVIQQRIGIARTGQIITTNQVNQYAKGAEDWAIGLLIDYYRFDAQGVSQGIKSPQSIAWPKLLPVTPISNGTVSATIEDLQARFNINNLQEKRNQGAFMRLLSYVEPKMDQTSAQQIMQNIVDWISTKSNKQLDGIFKASHSPLVSVSELRLVPGITADLYLKLLPFIAVLPPPTSININTATAPVLISLVKNITFADALELIMYRESIQGFKRKNEFFNLPFMREKTKGHLSNKNGITLMSKYFLVRAHVQIHTQSLLLYSMLRVYRSGDNKIKVNVLWRSRGTL